MSIKNKKNVLVVGGVGFIGSFLCNELLKTCDCVVAVDNLMRGRLENAKKLLLNTNFVFIKEDANNEDKIVDIVRRYQINYIFHLAANSDIQASSENPQIEFESTVKSTWSVLNIMRKTGIKDMFFASTSAVYGELKNDAFSEDDVLSPISYYGSGKMASEAFIKSFSYMNNFNALIFRFPNVIGPNLTHGVFFDFINRLKQNPKELIVLGDGTQSKPYMHVSDLVSGILSLCFVNHGVNVFNIGVETSTSVKDIAEMIVGEMNLADCKIKYGCESIGWKGDVPHFAYSLTKIYKTGWRPSMTSNEAALKTIREVLNKDKIL